MAPVTQYVFAEMLGISEHFTAGSHEWLPYSVDEVRLKSSNTNLSFHFSTTKSRTRWEKGALLPSLWERERFKERSRFFLRKTDKLLFGGPFWKCLKNTVGEPFMAPGGETYRLYERFGENVLRHGSHEWLPYSKNAVCTKSSNTNLPHS